MACVLVLCIATEAPISFPEAAILLVSTNDTSVSRSLDKGNAGSGNEIVRTIETNNISRNYSRWRRPRKNVTNDDSYVPLFSLRTLIALATTYLTQQKHSFNHGLER